MPSVDDQVVDELPPPDIDRPAAADPLTALLLAGVRRQIRRVVGYWAIGLLVVLAYAVDAWLRWGPGVAEPILVVVALAVSIAACLRLDGRWRATSRLLAAGAWRPVPAAMITGRVVELGGEPGGQVWVHGLSRPAAEMIARTGRVWRVGPDARGRLVLRVDGSPGCFPARRRARPRTGPPRWSPAPAGTAGTAADDPVVAAGVAALRHAAKVRLGLSIVGAGLVLIGYRAGWLRPVSGYIGFTLAVFWVVWWLMRWPAYRSLTEMLGAGPWTRVAVTLEPWRTGRRGDCVGTARARLADGGSLRISVKGTAGLFAAMERTGAVWVAGEPGRGRTVVVGFPGYPVFGVAALS